MGFELTRREFLKATGAAAAGAAVVATSDRRGRRRADLPFQERSAKGQGFAGQQSPAVHLPRRRLALYGGEAG